MSRSFMRRKRHWIALAVALYVADCVFLGYTPENYFLTTRVQFQNPDWYKLDGLVIPLGDSMSLDACMYDGASGSMYFFVNDCASRHPWLFSGESTGDGAVYWNKRHLTAVRAGRFKFRVAAIGRGGQSFTGEVVAPNDITLSTYDTTLHVGEELTVTWQVRSVANRRTAFADVRIDAPHDDGSIWWKELGWASPGGVRIRALQPGYTCLSLVGFSDMQSLRVVVVDSSGKSRLFSEPVAPDTLSARCGTVTVPHRDARASARTPRLVSPLADSITAQGARMAFAFQWCVAHAPKADTGDPMYSPLPRLGACSDSVQSIGRAWRISASAMDVYSATFTYFFGAGGATRVVTASGRDLSVIVNDRRDLDGRALYGQVMTLQRDELTAIRSAAACAQLHERQTGRIAPSIDSLRAFALSKWAAKRASTVEGCDYSELASFTPGSAAERNVMVHESGRFTMRYLPRGAHATIEVRPVRWGETGVVSYRYEAPALLLRTLEDRAPNARDERFDEKADGWSHAP